MGCLSVTISPILPIIVANAEIAGGAHISTLDKASHPEVSARAINRAEAYASKMNANADVSAWLVCNVGVNEGYLAVQEGWLVTIDNGYLTVRRV